VWGLASVELSSSGTTIGGSDNATVFLVMVEDSKKKKKKPVGYENNQELELTLERHKFEDGDKTFKSCNDNFKQNVKGITITRKRHQFLKRMTRLRFFLILAC
jgi:hypothetical protein